MMLMTIPVMALRGEAAIAEAPSRDLKSRASRANMMVILVQRFNKVRLLKGKDSSAINSATVIS